MSRWDQTRVWVDQVVNEQGKRPRLAYLRDACELGDALGLDPWVTDHVLAPLAARHAYADVRRASHDKRQTTEGEERNETERHTSAEQRSGPWKIVHSDAQAFQLGVLNALRIMDTYPQSVFSSERDPRRLPAWSLLVYLATLAWFVRTHNAIYIVRGLCGLRREYVYRPRHLATVYEVLTRSDWNETTMRRAGPTIDEYLAKQFGERWPMESAPHDRGRRLVLYEVPKRADDSVYQLLTLLIPWETTHVPDTEEAHWKDLEASQDPWLDGQQAAAHACFDQQQCLAAVRGWNLSLRDAFMSWELPWTSSASWRRGASRTMTDTAWRDHVGDLLAFINDAPNRLPCSGAPLSGASQVREIEDVLDVVVDRIVRNRLELSRDSSVQLYLDASDGQVELVDRRTGDLVATLPLMDPDDLPDSGEWTADVRLPSGSKLTLHVSPRIATRPEEPDALSLVVTHEVAGARTVSAVSVIPPPRAESLGPVQPVTAAPVPLAPAWRRARAWPIAAGLAAFLLIGVSAFAFNLNQRLADYASLVRELGFDEPFSTHFSADGQRHLRLDLSLNPGLIREVFVDFGDPANPDPVGGRRLYPGAGVPVGQGRLRLPPITHEYGAVPPEGMRTVARVRIVPVDIETVRPETLGKDKLEPARRLWVLPYGIILDPPASKLRFVSPKTGDALSQVPEVRIEMGALTADVHLLGGDAANPTVYRHLGKIQAPRPGDEVTVPRIVDTTGLSPSGAIKLVALSTNRLGIRPDGTIEWHELPQGVPWAEVELRQAGAILSPTPKSVVSGVGMVRAKVFLPNTHAIVVVRPATEGSFWPQNDPLAVTPGAEFSIRTFYGGRDTYDVYLAVTHDAQLFKGGDRLRQRPLVDRAGRPVYWVGPVEVTQQ